MFSARGLQTLVGIVLRLLIESFARALRLSLRRLFLGTFVLFFPAFKRFSKKRWLFNLDCHVSVVADIRTGLRDYPNVRLVSWSMSSHNFVFRRFFIDPDPVSELGGGLWKDLSDERITAFINRYSTFLRSFDGFVVTYPTSFVRLFGPLGRPILAVAATRYEHPFSRDKQRWLELDKELKTLHNTGSLKLVANNLGDAHYLENFLGIEVPVVPSLCDYVSIDKSPEGGVRVVQALSPELERLLAARLGPPWVGARAYLGRKYSWKKLSQVEMYFYVPHNSSTMTLFELATLGIPTAVPDPAFLTSLAKKHTGVMSELSFRGPREELTREDERAFAGADHNAEGFMKWWMDRADFYLPDVMPNVFQVSSTQDVRLSSDLPFAYFATYKVQERRNSRISQQRGELIREFVKLLEG